MGNQFQQRKRIIEVKNPAKRLTKAEMAHIMEAFDRIQEQQLINDYQFRIEVLGPQVPEVIAIKLFQLFCSDDTNLESMTFDDVLACYAVFKHARPEELGQLCFEIIKLTTVTDFLTRDHLLLFAQKIVQQSDQVVNQYYLKTKLDPKLDIQQEEFVATFQKVQNLSIFSWITSLVDGYQQLKTNFDDTKGAALVRRLTLISKERAKQETEKLGFDSAEYESMNEFFDREVKKNDAKEVLKTVQRMFNDIKDNKLRKYFIDSLTKHKALDFTYMSNMVFVILKEQAIDKKIDFLFELFSFHTDTIKKKQMKEFAEIFDLGINFFMNRSGHLTQDEFREDMQMVNLDFDLYEKTKYIIIAMMGLKAANEGEEKQSIIAALDHSHNLEHYINEHLDEEDTFFIIEKQFWDSWCLYTGFNENVNFSIKTERPKIIDNQKLVEPLHELRLQDVVCNEHFVILPKYVFYPLSKWYPCNKVIMRKVIKYKAQRNRALSLSKKRPTSQLAVLQPSEGFIKSVLDINYELEVYPKFIYYDRVTDKGEKLHQKAIVNQKIDQTYLKKVLKSDKIPFFELMVSRKTTFDDLLKIISATYKENSKRARLWIEDQVISGAKLEQNLEEFGMSMGQVVYVEFANANNQWPSDRGGTTGSTTSKMSSASVLTADKDTKQRTSGLYNLGNTCYMNAALQCIANTKFVDEYFVKQKQFSKQLNLKNVMGHQGDLAQNFAKLMGKMWQSQNVVVPRQFKNILSNISDQFQGYDQQDSQEFLSFVIDGLHEELNLRQKKPYITNPESDNRKVLDLALESWSNSLRRDWSFFYFIFYGQMKSTLNCKACNNISTTFDLFTNVPLSLPEPTKIIINVIISRQPNEIKDILNNTQSGLLKRVQSAQSEEFRIASAKGGDRDPAVLAQFQESFKYITNDQPIHICLRVDRDIKLSELQRMICEVKEVNISYKSETTELVLYSSLKGTIRGIFNPAFKLTQYNLLTNEIEAMEVITKKGRDVIKHFYKENPTYLSLNPNAHLTCLLKNSEQTLMPSSSITTNASSTKKRSTKSLRDDSQGIQIEKCNLFNSYQAISERYIDYLNNGNLPSEIFAVAYHRRFIKKTYHFFSPFQPQILANPIIFIMPLKPTGRRVYEEVWLAASQILKKGSIYHNKQNLWWEQPNWETLVNNPHSQFKPFVLKTVERSGYSCSQCNWMQMCSGCILSPTEDYMEEFLKVCHLAIEWHSSLIEEEYNQGSNEVLQHPSTSIKDVIEDDNINLEDCLRKFHEVEDMGSNDNIRCTNCKTEQEHLKSLEIFRPPPILIVQLKRFKAQGNIRKKLATLVEFPLFNLDLSTFVTDQEFLNQEGISQQYDLYGIINHYGNLHFGHYISIVKNLGDQKWYKYDDSHREQINEDQIQKQHAYILFYIRKDVQEKTLEELYPSINELFPGKPVTTSNGDGYIIKKLPNEDKYLVQTIGQGEPVLISSKEMLEEKDQNEIHYDEKDLQEISHKKKEKQNEMKQRAKRRRCCSLAPIAAHIRQGGTLGRGQIEEDDDDPGARDRTGALCNIY